MIIDSKEDKIKLEVTSLESKPYLLETKSTVWKHKISPYLLSLYNRYSLFSKRRNISKTKTKAEVSGGGRKPWRQKGTGRARQGSIRSPQWRGGGVVFGPTGNENYSLGFNKKLKKQVLSSLLTKKLSEKKLLIIDKVSIFDYKTKNAILILKSLQVKNSSKVLLIFSAESGELSEYVKKSFANLVNVSVTTSSQINISKLFSSCFVVFTEKAFKEIEKRLI